MLAGTTSLLALEDTIAAIASAPGGGTRGIVRMSGGNCIAVAKHIFAADADANTIGLDARLPICLSGELRLPAPLGSFPAKMLLWPTRRSYTRQPTVEIHTFGSPPILQATVELACRHGARLATPGEFTLRAFLAGRIDLPQAEAVLGVIDARDQAGLQVALCQLAGNLSQPLSALRERLLDLLSHLEAGLDFVDEDLEFISQSELDAELTAAIAGVNAIEARMHSRAATNELPRVVLLGAPNAGKSSLFNALAGADAALVSPQAGTTRDYVSRAVAFAGVECLLIDTAGLEDSPTGQIQVAAQAASQRSRSEADLVLWCREAGQLAVATPVEPDSPTLYVLTKSDTSQLPVMPPGWQATSARTGEGLAELRTAISDALQKRYHGDAVPATAARCRNSLDGAGRALHEARSALHNGVGEEFVAAELRLALDQLGQVLGAVYTDDILDRIFSRFCIGK